MDLSIPNLMGLAREENEGLSTRFKVVVPGMADVTFKSCDGMSSRVQVISYPEGGRQGAPRTARGTTMVNEIAFSHGSATSGSGGRSVFDWYQDVKDSSKKLEKKTLSVMTIDSQGKTLSEWRIVNAWPCAWNSPSISTDQTQLTVEYVSFAHEGIERKK